MENSTVETTSSDDWVPRIGMEFNSHEQAWDFWVTYGGRMGFNVRKHYANKNKNGHVSSRRFVCSKEGLRVKDKRDESVKNHRAETRTGCLVRMSFSLDSIKGKYVVHDFVSEHNHILHPPELVHLLSSQRKIDEIQAIEIELADKSGIKPREAHELNGAHVGGKSNIGYTDRDHRNYLRSKRQRDMMYGEAGSLLKYFHSQTIENPSFQYSIQLDCEEQMTNIFWADAKMLIDYSLFGDVVAFDTTFGTNKENRPLGVFVGFNHFRELVVFGVVLLYDETAESFMWLFKTFLETHDGKRPKTLFTDQDIAMGKAIAEVMPDTWHGLCTWHIMQNAVKHLMSAGSNVLKEFKDCVYRYDKEAAFEEAFDALRTKVEKSSWLDSIYALKEKWAECYMTNVFSLGMRSTQLSESFNKDLKSYLQHNLDITRFFHQFERVLRQKREKENNSEFESREKLPRLKLRRTPFLRQAGQLYTPKVFEAFQDEYEWSTAAYVKPHEEGQANNVFRVGISNLNPQQFDDIEYVVTSDPFSESVSCSCKMFERLGILCSHALKVLDIMNIKLIPEKYILKRWTREARGQIVQDVSGRVVLDDPQLDATRRYRDLCRKFIKVASRAASLKESSELLEKMVDKVNVEVEQVLSKMNYKEDHQSSPFSNFDARAEKYAQPHNLSGVTLKKKTRVQKTGPKRKKSWTEKFHKRFKRKKQDYQSNDCEETMNDNLQLITHQETTMNNIDLDTRFMNDLASSNKSQGSLGGNYPVVQNTLDMNSQFQQLISQGILGDLSNDDWLSMPFGD